MRIPERFAWPFCVFATLVVPFFILLRLGIAGVALYTLALYGVLMYGAIAE